MLYPKSDEKQLSEALFRDPTCEYRAAPFWAWNCDLKKEELLRQIDILREMGFGGYHMHVRAGLSIPYLGKEFMDLIAACVEKGKEKGMLSWLYDEDRWPSGFAGGLVTKDKQYRKRMLMFSPALDENGNDFDISKGAAARASKDPYKTQADDEDSTLLCSFDVELNEQGALRSYRRLQAGETAKGTVWNAYLQIAPTTPRFNNQTYVDTLNKKALDRFIDITYHAYYDKVGKEFGGAVPAIFTDEPQFATKTTLPFAHSRVAVVLPWTNDLPETFGAAYGEDLIASLPELIWEKADGTPSTVRYHYHDHVCERFTEAFADNCGKWCEAHGLALTGHMMREASLDGQTSAVGEVMRAFRNFQLPGIDMLADYREYITAKQTQSAVHQYGREGMMSELYGVTGWDFDFRRHKIAGDWQAALGVTIRVPHLSWVSMKGEAKRDYPASINYQSPWYKEYAYIEDHFARANTALTRGVPKVRVGMIHPIESFWLHWGPSEQTDLIRKQLDEQFADVTKWMLFGNIDFDYISESLLPEQCKAGGAPLQVGQMAYDVILVPGCETLRKTTLERLEAFQRAGGKLVFMGEAPKYLDAVVDPRPAALYAKAVTIPFARAALLDALHTDRDIEIRNDNGTYTKNLIHQLRQDGDCLWLFVAQGTHPYNHDLSKVQRIRIAVKGAFAAELYNTLDGSISKVSTRQRDGQTYMDLSICYHDSLLLKLTPHTGDIKVAPAEKAKGTPLCVPTLVDYTLDEPNALLLDMAEIKLDNENWRPAEEMLRADTAIRRQLGYDVWGSAHCQPWCAKDDGIHHTVKVRMTFTADIPLSGATFAAELGENADICVDGTPICGQPVGYYVDKDINTYALPELSVGTHTVEYTMPYNAHAALEWCYILGDFGVYPAGRHTTITKLPEKLGFGDITRQFLPFYSGKLTYHLPVETKAGLLKVQMGRYRSATVLVSANGGKPQQVSLAPFIAILPVKEGCNRIDVDAYISRTNGFGPLHLADEKMTYVNPNGWRTKGDAWTYDYMLSEEGVTAAPTMEHIPKA